MGRDQEEEASVGPSQWRGKGEGQERSKRVIGMGDLKTNVKFWMLYFLFWVYSPYIFNLISLELTKAHNNLR